MTKQGKDSPSQKTFDYINYFQFLGAAITLYLALIWAKCCPFPSFLPSSMEIEPWTIIIGIITALPSFFRKNKEEVSVAPPPPQTIIIQQPSTTAPAVERPMHSDPNSRQFVSRLPSTAPTLFGRKKELALLDEAWDNHTCHLLQFIAWGGVGKTGLVTNWLLNRMADGSLDGVAVYAWSFYSQGASETQQSSADLFLVDMLRWFGEDEATLPISPHDRGRRLADLIRRQRTLLILDGLEPLQYPPGELEGQLKDQGLRVLLREIAAQQPGLCLITSRIAVKDVEQYLGKTARHLPLEQLSDTAGAELLRSLGVKGLPKELETAAAEFKGHALALRLLGHYLAAVHKGDIRRRDKVAKRLEHSEKDGGHARRVMDAYIPWLGADSPEIALLLLIGLFDRPAPIGALEAVMEAVGNGPGLLNLQGLVNLRELSPEKQTYTLHHLIKLNLLVKNEASDSDHSTSPGPHLPGLESITSLDAHPLVREHFGALFEKDHPDAWRQCHAALYTYYKDLPKKERPDTLEEMEPLFAAVAHGCRARLYNEALDEVYWKRIKRGNENYLCNQLGAFGSDLTVLAWFFERPWDKPAERLTEADKAVVLSWAGYRLRALGRLGEAAQPMKAGLEMRRKQKNWLESAKDASNLSELYLSLGDLRQAVAFGQQSVEFADKSGDGFEKESDRSTYADALHQSGSSTEAARYFAEAEVMQRERQPEYAYLYSFRGFRYCDLLMSEGKMEEVLKRAKHGMKIAKRNNWLLNIALDHLSLGKAYHLLSQNQPIEAHQTAATHHLNEAVAGLRKAGTQHNVPLGLLARAAWHRDCQAYPAAATDLAEVEEIASAGGMKRHLCDYHLESARLAVAEGKPGLAKEHVEVAERMVRELGYGRRDGEVAALRAVVG